ncbi:MAG TPA: DUF6059 family protein [Trebonia sp.]|jgi:hypothetical protein|nr:DUF6059 family protein [Trebonia sp.]
MYYQSPVFDLQVAQAIAARGRSRAGYDPYWAPVLAAPELPPGHPEALAAGVPLSPGERALWSDVLGRPVRRRRPWHR